MKDICITIACTHITYVECAFILIIISSRGCYLAEWLYVALIFYELKSVGSLEIEFVAPIPEQLKTITMHLCEGNSLVMMVPDPWVHGCTEF